MTDREHPALLSAEQAWAIYTEADTDGIGLRNIACAQHAATLAWCVAQTSAVRDDLGRIVRETWVMWAAEQPSPKASWLVPWDALGEPDREVGRRIGERLYALGQTAVRHGWPELDGDGGQP